MVSAAGAAKMCSSYLLNRKWTSRHKALRLMIKDVMA